MTLEFTPPLPWLARICTPEGHQSSAIDTACLTERHQSSAIDAACLTKRHVLCSHPQQHFHPPTLQPHLYRVPTHTWPANATDYMKPAVGVWVGGLRPVCYMSIALVLETAILCQRACLHTLLARMPACRPCLPACMPAHPACCPACTPCLPACMHAHPACWPVCTPCLLAHPAYSAPPLPVAPFLWRTVRFPYLRNPSSQNAPTLAPG